MFSAHHASKADLRRVASLSICTPHFFETNLAMTRSSAWLSVCPNFDLTLASTTFANSLVRDSRSADSSGLRKRLLEPRLPDSPDLLDLNMFSTVCVATVHISSEVGTFGGVQTSGVDSMSTASNEMCCLSSMPSIFQCIELRA